MYNEEMRQSMAKVEANRKANAATEPRRMTAEEKEKLLATFHPDYIKEQFATLTVGPNKGEKVPLELRDLLEANSRVKDMEIDLEAPDYDVDVLIIGGGGAGSSAAIEAHEKGANVMIVTKLRIGDANTMMAEGGIQAADKPNDSPAIHYVDALGGGHFANKPELLYRLVNEAPDAIKWLNDLGVEFDKITTGHLLKAGCHITYNTNNSQSRSCGLSRHNVQSHKAGDNAIQRAHGHTEYRDINDIHEIPDLGKQEKCEADGTDDSRNDCRLDPVTFKYRIGQPACENSTDRTERDGVCNYLCSVLKRKASSLLQKEHSPA